MTVAGTVSLALLFTMALPLAYLYLLAAGAIRRPARPQASPPRARFAAAIPAHDEEPVIGRTVATLRGQDYPAEDFDVYVVADHCSDETATLARQAGAACYERMDGPRSGKGAALGWLFAAEGESLEIATLFCKQSVVIIPDNGLFRHRLGRLYLRADRLEDALIQLKEATRLEFDSTAYIEQIENRRVSKAS